MKNKQTLITKESNSNSLANFDDFNIFNGEIIEDPVEQYKLKLGGQSSSRTVETRIKRIGDVLFSTTLLVSKFFCPKHHHFTPGF